MFLYSNIIGALFLVTEAMLAWVAFASLENSCVPPENATAEEKAAFVSEFPCAVSGLYN